VGTFPIVARDPTGAGDVYAAAFLVAMSEGAGPADAALLASAAASIVVEEEGGVALERLGDCRERAAAVPLETAC
jgi:sugar/nucleoside kinase (ribokinase family)